MDKTYSNSLDLEWISTNHIGENTITDFQSFHAANLSNYTEQELSYILPLIKGDALIGHEENSEDSETDESSSSHSELLTTLKTEDNAQEEEEEEEEEVFHIHDNTVVDTSNIEDLMNMSGINALLNDDETIFTTFTHAIDSWFHNDPFLADIESAPCRSDQMESIIFIQFMLTWFGGFLAGGYAASVLGIRNDHTTDFDLFLPVVLTCRQYSACIHSMSNNRPIVQQVRTYFITCLKQWLIRYTHKNSHKSIQAMENAFDIFGYFAIGLLKLYPRAIVNIIFPNLLTLFTKCIEGLPQFFKRKLRASAIHLGFCRITDSDLTDLHVILHFQPYMNDIPRKAWTAFNLLSNFHINYARCLVGEFGILKPQSVSIGRMHSLYFPNWQSYPLC